VAIHRVSLLDVKNTEKERNEHQSECDLVPPVALGEEFPDDEKDNECGYCNVCPVKHEILFSTVSPPNSRMQS
jgi:hypothetical protein